MLFNRRGLFPFQAGIPNYSFPIKRFNWASFLTNANKTLGVVNQTIPLVHQVGPIWRNAKTMFKVFGEFRKTDKENTTKTNTDTKQEIVTNNNNSNSNNSPSFFV